MKKGKIKRQFYEAVEYLKISRKYIYYSIFIFILSAGIGFIFSERFGFLNELIKGLLDKTTGMNFWQLTFFILQSNIKNSFFVLILGMLFGIFPIFSALMNGVVVGYVLRRTADIAGVSQFWRILPHGIFELPAIFISLGLGIKLGFFFFNRKKKEEFKDRFYESINTFLMIVVPLLIIAAIIESLLIIIFK